MFYGCGNGRSYKTGPCSSSKRAKCDAKLICPAMIFFSGVCVTMIVSLCVSLTGACEQSVTPLAPC